MKVIRTGLYERVSTDEQAVKGFSIQAQIDNLTEYAKQNNMKIVDHYTDEGISGAKPPLKRPGLQRLLEDVQAGKIDMILFTKLDRWFRSVKEYFKVQDVLDTYGVQWKAIHENYDTTTANGQMAITMFLAIAQNERDRTSERIKVVLEHKRKNKEACFSDKATPLGYIRKRDENGIMRLVKDPKTRDAMQEFWDIIVCTNNMAKAIRVMNNKYGIRRDRSSWGTILRSDFYCGVHRGVSDFCEPYVEPEIFLKILEKRPIKATPTGRIYLFKGLIRCSSCGKRLVGDVSKTATNSYKQYRCNYRHRGCVGGTSISERKIEKQMLCRLEEFVRNDIAKVEIELSKPKSKSPYNVPALKEQLRRLTVAYLAGNMNDEEYNKDDAELKAMIKKAEEFEPDKPRDVSHLKKLLETDFYSLYITLDEEEKQTFWIKLIRRIDVKNKIISNVDFV